MLRRVTMALALFCGAAATTASADQTWLQIEARPSASGAIDTARGYALRIDDVASYALRGSRWSAIVIGPFDEDEIADRRRALRARGLIPADSFVSDGANFGERLFPAQADADPARDDPGAAADPAAGPDRGETRAQARRSEARLDGAARREIQSALRWAGTYRAAIDGAFGRGTRMAMRRWQEARGYPATGVLTTRQRAELLRDYNAVLDGLGVEPVTDETAGITVAMPTELVGFDRYEPPFAHYPSRAGAAVSARLLLISQQGDRAELHGLYDLMQTLEIVPADGARQKRAGGFSLTGRDNDIVSRTEAWLEAGQIKGFTLIWPAGDEARRTRLVEVMIDGFRSDPDRVMEESLGEPTEAQSVDLLAGLKIRTPSVSRSGFFVSRRGAVLTTLDATRGCERITIDDDVEARVAATDAASGLALLEPGQPLAPRRHARLRDGVPRLNAPAILAGYSFDGQLGAPSLTYGSLAAMRGLDGETDIRRYALAARAGDAGGPVFDADGTVLGMLRPAQGGSRALPEGVVFATDAETIRDFLAAAGVTPPMAPPGAALPSGQLARLANDMTVLVGCWK